MKKTTVLLVLLLLLSLLPACQNAEQADSLTDGTYQIEVTLSGGSGKTTIESPATLVVDGDTMTATIVWSSPNYEYMLIGDVQYDPVQTEGNSTFEIPVVLDTDMEVSASTIAMSQPHLVDYTLHFDSSTVQ